jgi:hypothetical protein
MSRIETETVLLPYIIADATCARMGLNSEALVEHLVTRAERCYASNKRWAKKIRSAAGRDFLYAFMEHWAKSVITRNGPVCLACQPSLPRYAAK